MTSSDVALLHDAERRGVDVISWHSAALWERRKRDVDNEETALRLSKLLRDNRHTVMHMLGRIAEHGHYTFLASLLELQYAEYDVSFKDLRIEHSVTVFSKLERTKRGTKYAEEQKARRCRVAFNELKTYLAKENRNEFVVWDEIAEKWMDLALQNLQRLSKQTALIDAKIQSAWQSDQAAQDNAFRAVVRHLVSFSKPPGFVRAKVALRGALAQVARLLSDKWNDERYVRPDWS